MHDVKDFEIFEKPGCLFLICKLMYGSMTKSEILDACCDTYTPDEIKDLIVSLGRLVMIRPVVVKRKPGLAFELTDHGFKIATIADVLGNIVWNDSTHDITGMYEDVPGGI